MGLIRLLSLLLALWVLWLVLRNFRRKQHRQELRKLDAGRVVKCRYCDVHLPEQQALTHGDSWFCTKEHRQAWMAEDHNR